MSFRPACSPASQVGSARGMAASASWRLVDSTGSELHVEDGLALGRQQLGPDFGLVSRKQAVLTFDGSQLYLTSTGQNPTGLLPAGSAEWQWLRPQDARVPVTPGSAIALDKKQLDTTRFTLLSTPLAACGTSADEANWSCSLCTFDNIEADASCAMCEAPRAGVKRARTESSLCDRVGDDMRIRWDTAEHLDVWLSATRPSKVSNGIADWIQVENATDSPGYVQQRVTSAFDHEPYLKELAKVEAIIARSNRVPAEAKRACVQSLLELAQEQRYTTGKWMVFLSPDEADAAWETIARATAQGELGCSAKIAPTADLPPTERTVCCVYVDDFANRAEVQRVLRALQRLDMDITSGFKPDVYTELNIMRDNRWRLEPTIYKVAEVLEWPDGVARAEYTNVRASPWG